MNGGKRRQGLQALLIWCERVTRPYTSVSVRDLSSSFKDGLAFVAIIHRFRPELIGNPDGLNGLEVVENNALAFGVAEEHLDIPALLDPLDMADSEVPDTFSVATYLAQLYHCFKNELVEEVIQGQLRSPEAVSNGSSTGNTPSATPPTLHRHVRKSREEMENNEDNKESERGSESKRGSTLVAQRRAIFEADNVDALAKKRH